MTPIARRIITGGRVFTANPEQPWAEAVVTEGPTIAFVGTNDDALAIASADAKTVDAKGGLIMPGFVDGHVHVSMTGGNLETMQLRDAPDLAEIQRCVQTEAATHPDAPRIRGNSWVHSSVPDGTPTRAMIDAVEANRPVYLMAHDFHSAWVNTAALAELGITTETPDPIGGEIVRDDHGDATGWLLENACVNLVWPLLEEATSRDEEKQHILTALEAYARAGVTSVVEMALFPTTLELLAELDAEGALTTRIVAHVFIPRSNQAEELAAIGHAAELAQIHQGDRFRIAGIKIVVDGTIDGCTAALRNPYVHGASAEPIWNAEALRVAVTAADAAGLQVAVHAIGDWSIGATIDAIEHAQETNGDSGRRHRIEHLEYATEADIARLGPLGITASMQPVHVDPAILENWIAVIGPERGEQGFAWPLYLAAGATLAFGTDTPTAPLEALPNMYIAATRKSPSDPSLTPHRPDWALPLEEALLHGTRESAWAARLETRTGVLREGLAADVVVLSADPLAGDPSTLLDIDVVVTIADGVMTHQQ